MLNINAFALEIGVSVDQKAVAEQLIMDTRSHLEELRSNLSSQPPLLVIQLVNEHYVRVYGENRMFQEVLRQLNFS